MKVYAIIPAGGSGKRIGSGMPKQYVKFHGKELIAYTLDVFQRNDLIDSVIVAAQKEYFHLLRNIKEQFGIDKLDKIAEGGKERQDSVFNALSSIPAEENDLIAVHDAARPLLPGSVLTNAIKTAEALGSAVVSIKAMDTLVKGSDKVIDYVDREEIRYIQTPQIFRYGILYSAMKKAKEENFTGTDESMIVKRYGGNVSLSEGSTLNFKITTESDIRLFHLITEKKDIRTVFDK